jgi:hypothetical protein
MREGTVEGRGGSFTLIMGPPISSSLYVHVWWPLQVRSSHLVHHGSTSVLSNYEALIFVKARSPPSERTQRESERASEGECVCECVCERVSQAKERGGGV